MKLSILLPTRNGGRLLDGAIRSVLDQDGDDFELVISDNASDETTREVLAQFAGDPRLKLSRLEAPVNVTDNWQVAYEAASGDYLLLLGDDDYLRPGAIRRILDLLREHGDPDALSYEAFGYAFPGALPGATGSAYADPLFPPDPILPARGLVPAATRRELALDVFRFSFRFCLNLQTTVISRAAAESMPGGPFKPPFPDFYVILALLLRAERWAYSPERLVIVGVSPKSFGRTLHGGGQDGALRESGMNYLGITTQFDGWLPGNEMLNGTWITLEALLRDFPAELRGVEISRDHYVAHQVFSWYQRWRLGWMSRSELVGLLRGLPARDWLALGKGLRSRLDLQLVRRRLRVNRDEPAREFMPGMRPLPDVDDISGLAKVVGPA
ncbi:glycosyltransferase [Solirubrobacter taibaiensis]|nr:glycosyltransferase [Solirubrobacter taibaiensis]